MSVWVRFIEGSLSSSSISRCGLISTKTPAMESQDELKKRVENATRYLDLYCLAVSPQCGFASLDTGNPITPEVQEQKLRLVVDLAREIWGEA
jgi:methionine synthase II (cobalamin-independent)